VPVLLEVKTSPEPSKHGVAPEAAGEVYAGLRACANLEPLGLMTMAPFAATMPKRVAALRPCAAAGEFAGAGAAAPICRWA
jgi:uncharacterized pyridoxal phosphate-containing UPF0001 family protein